MYAADRIKVAYGPRTVLAEASLEIPPGRFVALAGPNGAGKSTLLKAMTGDLPIAAGVIRLDGRPVAGMPPAALARRRAVLPQASALAFPFTVHEVVRLGVPPEGRATAVQRVEAALRQVDLAGFAGRFYQELSGGERQRAHLARVLCQIPSPVAEDSANYLFLDEPTASLDLKHQISVLRIARQFADNGGGVLAVLHDLNLAAMFADEIVVLRDGAIIAAGAPRTVIVDATIEAAFDVALSVGVTPSHPMPFILPQSVRPD
jgi:iron complex transport system ATP-binding protein